eukprot:Skav212316  [mRNA]  locus=scaffold3374:118720:121724:- [translate_table: standard]
MQQRNLCGDEAAQILMCSLMTRRLTVQGQRPAFEALGHCFVLSFKNLCDYGSAVMGRWVMFTWTCRAFPWAGEKILPVLQAWAGSGGILLVTGLIFAGFWHAFAALTLAQKSQDQFNEPRLTCEAKVLLATLRFMVLGDGDGAAVIVGLYNGDEAEKLRGEHFHVRLFCACLELGSPITFVLFSLAVIAFCICLLNLFIAVHSEAYDKAQETAHISFLQAAYRGTGVGA